MIFSFLTTFGINPHLNDDFFMILHPCFSNHLGLVVRHSFSGMVMLRVHYLAGGGGLGASSSSGGGALFPPYRVLKYWQTKFHASKHLGFILCDTTHRRLLMTNTRESRITHLSEIIPDINTLCSPEGNYTLSGWGP